MENSFSHHEAGGVGMGSPISMTVTYLERDSGSQTCVT